MLTFLLAELKENHVFSKLFDIKQKNAAKKSEMNVK